MPQWKSLTLCFSLMACSFGQSAGDSSGTIAIETALRAHDFEQALQLAHSRLRELPNDAKLWTLEGIALSKLGRDKEALNAYDRALRISPKYVAALEGAAELEYKAESARARPLLEQLLKLRPDDPTTHAMLGVLAYKE